MGIGYKQIPPFYCEIPKGESLIPTPREQNHEDTDMKHMINIHHTNLFRPNPLPITKLDLFRLNKTSLAVIKEYVNESTDDADKKNQQAVNIIEVYRLTNSQSPKILVSIYDYETITGISWISAHHFITVTKEQTINLYNAKRGIKVFSHLTDYGPINSMKINLQHNLIMTGTEYGYAVAYKFKHDKEVEDNFELEFLSKMVKVNEKITSIEFTVQRKEKAQPNKKITKRKICNRTLRSKKKREDHNDDDSIDTSSSSESEHENEEDTTFLGGYDAIIFGACQNEVIAWDFHKHSIIETIRVGDKETCRVNTLLSLYSGDLITGNSDGTISFFDGKTLTCKYYTKILEGEILAIAKNDSQTRLLVSGKDTSIAILKRGVVMKDEYVLFERVELHSRDVTTITFAGRKNFLSGSLDGTIGRFRLTGGRFDKVSLDKDTIIHNYSNNIRFSNQRMLIQAEMSLTVWRLPKLDKSYEEFSAEELHDQKPIKQLQLKTRNFIQASAISQNLIAYATRRGVNIYLEYNGSQYCYTSEKELTDCTHLEFCFDNKILAVAQYDKVNLLDLGPIFEQIPSDSVSSKASGKKLSIIGEKNLQATINQMTYAKSMGTLFVSCSGPKAYIHIIKLSPDAGNALDNCHRFYFKNNEILFFTYNSTDHKDHNLYVYTNDDKIIRFKPETYNSEPSQDDLYSHIKKVQGIPETTNIIGMFMITDDLCILYDSKSIFKVDIGLNRVISHNDDYNYIIKISNSVFNTGDEAALVELTPDDYIDALPSIKEEQSKKMKRKFGT